MYRLYLKNRSGLVVGREDFEAIDRAQALSIAAAIFNACSDIAADYELWMKDEQILSHKGGTGSGMRAALSDHQQQIVIDVELALRASNWLVADSQRLIQAIEKLNSAFGTGTSKPNRRQTGPSEPAVMADPADTIEGFVAGIESPALRALAKHWDEVRGDKAMPSWDDLSSSALAPHFKLLWGYQFDRQKREFTGKLAGTHIRQWLGAKFCRAKLKDIHPPHVLKEAHAFLVKVVTTPGVGLCSGRLFTVGGHTVTGERLALPLASNGASADGILGASDFIYPSVSGPVALIHENIEWCPISECGGPGVTPPQGPRH